MKAWAWRAAVALSAAVVATLAASFVASQGLPSGGTGAGGCHWTQALIPLVRCPDAPGGLREAFLNAWATALAWSPAFGLSMPFSLLRGDGPAEAIWRLPLVLLPGIVSWGAVVVLARAAWLALRR